MKSLQLFRKILFLFPLPRGYRDAPCPPSLARADWLAEALPHCWLEAYAATGERVKNVLRVVYGRFMDFSDLTPQTKIGRQAPLARLRVAR